MSDIGMIHVVTRQAPLILKVTNDARAQEWLVYVTVDDNGEPRAHVSWLGPVEDDVVKT